MKTYGEIESLVGLRMKVITEYPQVVGFVSETPDYLEIVFLPVEEVDDLIVQLSEWLEKYHKGEVT